MSTTNETIIEWLTDSNTCFLFGTGCSICVGKPSLKTLTENVIKKLGKPSKDLLDSLAGSNGRKATIEDFLNQLLQIKSLLQSRKDKKLDGWDIDKTDNAIKKTLQEIVSQIGGEWKPSTTHERFLKRVAHHAGRRTCDLFTLNYDITLEATLESLRLPYTDGFCGAENAYFDPSLYATDNLSNTPLFKLYKLHGSINWIRDNHDAIRRTPTCAELEKRERQVIYPSEQKYYQTQYGIYETLLNLFRQRLREDRPNNKLVILGYSLSDNHINEAIIDAVCEPRTNLTVYALLGEEENVDAQIERLTRLVSRCPTKFNIIIGNKKFIGSALEPQEWETIKAGDFWKFENLVDLLTKGIQ